jgi:hypothetical protein
MFGSRVGDLFQRGSAAKRQKSPRGEARFFHDLRRLNRQKVAIFNARRASADSAASVSRA